MSDGAVESGGRVGRESERSDEKSEKKKSEKKQSSAASEGASVVDGTAAKREMGDGRRTEARKRRNGNDVSVVRSTWLVSVAMEI